MNANDKAMQLRRKLFDLVNEFKDLNLPTRDGTGELDSRAEGSSQIDDAACKLATVYESLGPIFTDTARDPKDQQFAVALKTDW